MDGNAAVVQRNDNDNPKHCNSECHNCDKKGHVSPDCPDENDSNNNNNNQAHANVEDSNANGNNSNNSTSNDNDDQTNASNDSKKQFFTEENHLEQFCFCNLTHHDAECDELVNDNCKNCKFDNLIVLFFYQFIKVKFFCYINY